MKTPASNKVATDWERIEADYRAGLLSVREIAASQGISHVAIAKRAKRDGWERDLGARIKAKADALVTSQLVTTSVTTEKAVTDKAIVDANAQVIANIRLSHRTDISRSRSLAMKLIEELEHETDNRDLYEQLGELMYAPDKNGIDRLNEIYHKVISLPGRTGTMKALSDTLKTLIGLEREAYGIVDAQKLDINAKIQSDRKPQELSDDELLAIATGSGAGITDKASGQV